MIIGHLGAGRLNWLANQISTYAAVAPHDHFITASILLSSFTLLVVALLVSRHQIVGTSVYAHLIPLLAGAAASGLIVLSCFEETASSISQLKNAGFWAIRVQSFHDAGLLIFFYSSMILVMLLGVLVSINTRELITRLSGGAIAGMGPVSYFLMTTAWPKYVGLQGITVGANERASLFCLWLAVVLLLAHASRGTGGMNREQ